jgi:hypothetical protein
MHTIMNILLQIEDKAACVAYVNLSLQMLGKSPVARLLRDQVLFWTLFELFRYNHF